MQAVLNDPPFANVETTWDFYLVVCSIKDRLMPQLRQKPYLNRSWNVRVEQVSRRGALPVVRV
ncbi:hypothetical protein ACWCQN_41025 [Streptomyces sp. NPDC001984]|uniref:hypothetical protein n=1 Tax=Streptomyces sp. NPDC002619 TaxID=3364655 RepID=UPI003696A327